MAELIFMKFYGGGGGLLKFVDILLLGISHEDVNAFQRPEITGCGIPGVFCLP
jgi:hypothetical protein